MNSTAPRLASATTKLKYQYEIETLTTSEDMHGMYSELQIL